MIKILNKSRQLVAILENAYNIGYERGFNQIWWASFSLPLNDPKNAECKPLNYVEVYDHDEYVGLFRIIPKETVIDEGGNTVTYQCEHVLATLLDSSIFKYRQIDGLPTSESIKYVLGFQNTKHWVLDKCELTRYFSYKFENDNVLSALFSIPKPFDQDYQWTFNTTVYPWKLSLVIPESEPTCEIREKKNLRGLTLTEDPMGIFNRIYPLGYGEGDNQLTIESVNGGVPYVEDAASIAENGLRVTIWSDRRFEDAKSLKASAEGLLRKWKELIASWKISAADLSSITGEDIDKLKMGRIVRVDAEALNRTIDLRIIKEKKSDVKGAPGAVDLEIGNKTMNLGDISADVERRQQINELYSQGATNLLSYSYNDNADAQNPAEIVFFLPDEMVKLNKLTLWFETTNFRAYEKAIGGGGAILTSTKSGGNSTVTSAAGGSTTVTSATGGQSTISSEFANPGFFLYTSIPLAYPSLPRYEEHVHAVEVTNELNHQHVVKLPSHQHQVTIGSHQHSVSVPAHSHDIELENHEHALQFGIFKLPETPTNVTIKVDGNPVSFSGTSGEDIDLVPYLNKDSDGRVSRGKHVVSLTPNDRGRINAQINTQFFIQSRGDYTL